ncbi:serine hydrolase domain-containing protein [Adhaeribacter pallidiroseus]|uniref:6-aminohexanoate-oligomer exohydrolase n=1 Tax=Adhaeribacter pallidiroseus TaxID=2072847 RepID=A0A369QJV6_9BACT|nr:serine hydrolase [Adhaeribacter pallidiroseus]RDC65014.1 6-aminohexanoate-oligomer exohydrolase [Adhaeribacter pallidiroseus]
MTINRRNFLKSTGVSLAGISLFSISPKPLWAEPLASGGLPRSSPERQGIASQNLLAFIEAVEKDKLGLHSLMVVRHGKVAAEGWWAPYAPDLKHTLFSLSKSFTSTGIGLAVAEGKLKITDKVISFFPQELPPIVSTNLAAMRIKDLLTMTSGHDKDTIGPLIQEKAGSWVRTFLALPVEHEPGTHFLYNTGATYMLSAIVQKVTGQNLLDYLTPRLLQPLGIIGADWETDPQGIATGGFGLRIRTEDIAKFGQLYLQKGMYNGKQILPATWVAEATAYQVPNATATTPAHEWNQGYGYQFWRSRHQSYRGDGAMGQYCLVLPEQDAVIAITSETSNMQAILNQVWEHILPAMKPAALSANAASQKALKQKLASLTLLPAQVNSTSPVAKSISGKTFKLADNDLKAQSVSFSFTNNACTFKLQDAQETHQITCGLNTWVFGESRMPGEPPRFVRMEAKEPKPKEKIAAFGTWKNPDTFEMTWVFNETPHSETVTCFFENGTVRLEYKDSVAAKAPERAKPRPTLEGRLA